MKKKLILLVFTVFVFVCGLMVSQFFASSVTPGTTGDPLVSKSYVDAKLSELAALSNGQNGAFNNTGGALTDISKDQLLADIMSQLELYYADALGGAAGGYAPVSLAAGQVVLGGEGTEIILRSGAAKGYVDGLNGIADATDGTEIGNDSAILVNHLLIVPRDDGRGVEAQTDCWFMVKGDYQILN